MYEFIKRYYRLLINKPSYWTTWFQNNALRVLQEHWGRVLLAMMTLAGFLLLITWINGPALHARLDLTLKIIGGLFLIIGLGIATWRSAIFERQIESAVKGQYSERFAKAVEQIASDQLAIRLGGLASIEALSKETEGEFIRVWTYLGEFLRYPPELAQWRDEPKTGMGTRPDIAAVATMLCSFDKTHLRWMKEKRLSLRDAKLQGAKLFYVNLQGAHLIHAKLQGAKLIGANLIGAKLTYANLQNANLLNAKLQNANLFHTNLEGTDLFHAHLQGANLEGANLQSANLQNANLQGADLQNISLRERDLQQLFSKDSEVLLKDALFSLDALTEALHIKDLAPEKMSDIYYDASDGPLPEDWPADYKPRPITYAEWWRAKEIDMLSNNESTSASSIAR